MARVLTNIPTHRGHAGSHVTRVLCGVSHGVIAHKELMYGMGDCTLQLSWVEEDLGEVLSLAVHS